MRFGLTQVDLQQGKAHEKGFPDAVRGGGSEGDLQAGEGLWELDIAATELRGAVSVDAAHVVVRIVDRYRQLLGKGDRAGAVAAGRRRPGPRPVRAPAVLAGPA